MKLKIARNVEELTKEEYETMVASTQKLILELEQLIIQAKAMLEEQKRLSNDGGEEEKK